MAGRKEYEMMFKLQAQLDSSFASSFNSAKGPLVEMQGEIQRLNSLQADVSAYTKQQAAVDKLRDRLSTLQQQYGNIKTEMESTGNASAAMQNKLLAKQQQIDKTSVSVDSETQKLYGMSDALAAAGIDTDNLAAGSAKLDGQIAALKAEQIAVTASTSGFSAEVDALYQKLGNISAFQSQQQIVEKTDQKLQILLSQYKNIQTEMGQTGSSSDELKARLEAKQQQIDRTTQALTNETGKLNAMDAALAGAGVNTGNLAAQSNTLEAQIIELTTAESEAAKRASEFEASLSELATAESEAAEEANEFGSSATEAISSIEQALAAAGIVAAVKQIYDGFAACAEASIEFESGMTGVSKTTDLTESELREMAAAVKQLSTEIPVATSEFMEIGEVAGQLGIAKENLLDFSTVMSKLSTATTMAAEEGATMLAQFANITQMNPRYYENLASVIVDLGNNYATTEQKIVGMSQGIAASASIAGMAEADIAAISAAVSSLGIESAAGSTAMSKLISTLNTAVETGENLNDFGKVANMTGGEFAKAWGEDAASALATFIDGLSDTERLGKSATVIADELGLSEARLQRMVLSLAGSGDLLNNTLSTARTAWTENTALTAEAEKRYATTASRLQMLDNAFNNVKIAIGDNLSPVLAGLAPIATDALMGFMGFIERNPELVQAIMTAVAVFTVATAGITAYAAAAKIAAAVSALLSASIPGLNVILGVTAGVALLAGGIAAMSVVIKDSAYDFEALDEGFDQMNEQLEQQMHISDLCDEYVRLNEELGNTSKGLNSVGGNRSITLTAEQKATLTAEGFLIDDDTTVNDLTAEQKATLTAEGFLLDDETKVKDLTAEQKKTLAASGFMLDDEATIKDLTAEQKATLVASGFMLNGETTVENLTAEQKATLTAAGFMIEGADTVSLQGTPDESSMLTGDDFVGDTKVLLSPELGNSEAIEKQVLALKGKLENSAAELEKQRGVLTDLESQKNTLDEMFNGNSIYTVIVDYQTDKGLSADGIIGKNTLAALQKDLDKVTTAISTQKEKVDALDSSYLTLNAEYTTAQTATSELAAKQERLAEVKQQLIENSGGLITATEGETKAFNLQVAALAALSDDKAAELRVQAYESIKQQSKGYIQSIQDEIKYNDLRTEAEAKQLMTYAAIGEGAEGMRESLWGIFDNLSAKVSEMDASGMRFFDTEAGGAYFDEQIAKASEFASIVSGEKISFDGSGMAGLAYFLETANFSAFALEESFADANRQVTDYQGAIMEADGIQAAFLDNLVNGVRLGGMTWDTLESLLTETFSEVENGAEIVSGAMDYVQSAIAEADEAARQLAEGEQEVANQGQNLDDVLAGSIKQLEDLGKAYDSAYKSAYSSIEGQFDLFEKAANLDKNKTKAPSSDEMIASLESQAKYMADYSALLEKANEAGASVDLLSSLTDGSEESAAALEKIGNMGPEKIAELNAAFAGVQEGKDTFASTVAEMETDFATSMSKIETELTDTIAKMNLSSDAATSGKNTVQGFIDGAEGMLPQVAEAFQRVADAAKAALQVSLDEHSPSRVMEKIGVFAIKGFTLGVEEMLPEVKAIMSEAAQMGADAFTFHDDQFAARYETPTGSALEQDNVSAVYAARLSDGNTYIELKVAPTYTITGVGDARGVENVLHDHDDELREFILEVIEEAGIDSERKAYK